MTWNTAIWSLLFPSCSSAVSQTTLNFWVLGRAPDWGVRISQGNPFVVIISWSCSVQWFVSHCRFPYWKLEVSIENWVVMTHPYFVLFRWNVFGVGVDFFFVVILFWVFFCRGFLVSFLLVATYHSREGIKSHTTISCFLYCSLSAPGKKKGSGFLVFPTAVNSLLTFSWKFQTAELVTFLCGWNPKAVFWLTHPFTALWKQNDTGGFCYKPII